MNKKRINEIEECVESLVKDGVEILKDYASGKDREYYSVEYMSENIWIRLFPNYYCIDCAEVKITDEFLRNVMIAAIDCHYRLGYYFSAYENGEIDSIDYKEDYYSY